MPEPLVHYTSPDEDSARWRRFAFRAGDIVISTRSKHGTTWLQMICALLVFQTADLPAPLARLSPWIDWLVLGEDELFGRLDAQDHRRFVKTHTPLDGVPDDPGATYLVAARDPLDAAVSLYHQGNNVDRARLSVLTGAPAPAVAGPRPALHDWLTGWIERDEDPRQQLDSLPGVMWHLSGAWQRRHDPNVLLVHYDDLVADLGGQMRRLADALGIDVPPAAWPSLVAAAGFDAMRGQADRLAPDPSGVLKDRGAFFRRGGSGAARELLTCGELERYHARVAELAAPDLLAWLHRN